MYARLYSYLNQTNLGTPFSKFPVFHSVSTLRGFFPSGFVDRNVHVGLCPRINAEQQSTKTVENP